LYHCDFSLQECKNFGGAATGPQSAFNENILPYVANRFMIFVYRAKPVAAVPHALESIRKSCPGTLAVVVRKNFGCSKLLYFSLFLSLKSFQMARNRAKSVELEWLCRLACDSNVQTALSATTPVPGEEVAIASTKAFPAALKKQLGITAELSCKDCDSKFLSSYYGLSKESLKHYPLCGLAMERMAIEAAR
jgi:tRNA threonylcarbamoyladenosine modification (KEOPS) complex Cgi121 subunit